jgi:hypothetical protein
MKTIMLILVIACGTAFSEPNEIQRLREENARLKQENTELRAEIKLLMGNNSKLKADLKQRAANAVQPSPIIEDVNEKIQGQCTHKDLPASINAYSAMVGKRYTAKVRITKVDPNPNKSGEFMVTGWDVSDGIELDGKMYSRRQDIAVSCVWTITEHAALSLNKGNHVSIAGDVVKIFKDGKTSDGCPKITVVLSRVTGNEYIY